MGDLQEIVSVEAVNRLFAVVAVAAPFVGVAIGSALGARRGSVRHTALRGLMFGLFGPLNWLLWCIFNAITNRNGLDTVRNLAMNVAVFVVIGLVIGLLFRRLNRLMGQPEAPDAPSDPTPG